ncbi:polysaccharide biosynthesis tyrosine autokinase [Mammaliicoccus sciuri]|uniref:polysaccharide biosynthesis tyrosine autokinase n=1 Tax=Mammaliicoccus sciuri TaxID=1296 RepID=UPI0019501A31|nr:polysaccharide biosynthesis tyrosine autokinase [Mammaliicoccus sciuri]MEB6121379.1 polysaccharide biosynthesis tyrosine autokinase [Mammaliicoccus sciuri]MEB6286902.1 polysaccharide biosynthesis tyrosine autokinase [Mammaliicoccus sciuri]MEB6312368.1 polysaccharide biosynthesis tyrosine autokinase [Mammaliicoccus sciuri]MEB6695166.1 polysaccharide biosynthesis tyrosine autokinase [Mammaliicoccus sciuri]
MANNRNINPLITMENPKSVISEKFRGIRTNILFSTADNEVQTIVFTSEKPAAGKSTISANVAITYAQAGYKTLLIDGDMRKPTQHYIFNTDNIDGFSNLIINKTDYNKAIHKTDIVNLDLLTSGPIPPNPSELIGSEKSLEVFEYLRNEYDFIIIDTPPVNTVTDAQLFSEIAKYVVYVIDVQKNDRNAIKKGKELIEKAGAKILGVILNKAPEDKSSSYYYYYGKDEK